MSSVSLCMIVKNEEEMLPGCLESIKNYIDEIVIVDTGSSDKTRDIASSFGAKLVEFEWINDFSAARNCALSHVTSDYALVLDADERLGPGSGEKLRQIITQQPFHLGLMSLHQASDVQASLEDVVKGEQRLGSPVLLPRLLRMADGIHYVGAVHEQPKYKSKAEYVIVGADIVHSGGDPNWRESKNKGERNLNLLLENMSSFKEMPLYWAYLASELSHAGRNSEVMDAIENGWNAVVKAIDAGEAMADSAIASIYPGILFSRGQFKEGLEAMKLVISKGTDPAFMSPNLMYFSGHFLSMMEIPNDLKQTVYELVKDVALGCISLEHESHFEELLPGVCSWRARELLGIANYNLGNWDEAIEIFKGVIDEIEETDNTRLWLAEAYISRGGQDDLREGLSILISLLEYVQTADPWILAAAACVALGEKEDARNFWEQATIRTRVGVGTIHRQRLFNGLFTMFNVLDGKPVPGKGAYGVLGAIMSRRPLQSVTPVPSFILEEVILRMIELDKGALLEAFFEARAEQVLPGVGDRVRTYLESLGVELVEDGELAPIFIGGSHLKTLSDIFGTESKFNCQTNFGYHNALLDKLWDYHLEKQLNQDFFSDSFGWLSDDVKTVTDDLALDGIRACISTLITGVQKDEDDYFIDFSEANLPHFQLLLQMFSRAKVIHVIEDPRDFVAKSEHDSEQAIKQALHQWQADIDETRSKCVAYSDRYLEISHHLMASQTRDSLARFLAFMGEAWNQELFDTIQGTTFENHWESKLSDKEVLFIEESIGDLMVEMGFALTQASIEE